MNTVMLVGRLEDIEDGVFTLKVDTSVEENEFEKYYIKVKAGEKIYDSIIEYCKVGDMIAVKGYLTNECVFAQKISFLSSKRR